MVLGTSIIIGRGRDCSLAIEDSSISRQHARLAVNARGTLSLTDLGSANGTMVGGRPIPPHRAVPLRIGEAASLGRAIIIVQDLAVRESARQIVSRELLSVLLEERCREAAETALPFRVASLTSTADVADGDLLTVLGPLLHETDALGAVGRAEWLLVLDDAPAGRALGVIKAVTSALAETAMRVTIGVATWPHDGRTGPALMAAASNAASKNRGRREVVMGRRMDALYETIDRIARSDLPMLIVGETGVGKEIAATRLHESSSRRDKPFIKLNCAALSETLLESELFGHVRGAFTGADRDKQGLLEAADGGTMFLDEIGEMPLAMQAKLLRVLEDKEVRRVGALVPHSIDVRFVAATNQRLDDATRFRADLYFRISGAVMEIPPLRERRDEILPLAKLFLGEYADRHGISPLELGSGAERVLETYAWPGNVRELRYAIERAAVVATGDVIEPHDFPITEMAISRTMTPSSATISEGPTAVTFSSRAPDRETIKNVLAAYGGNQHLAAEHLGVHRRTLMRWMDLLKLARPRKS
jgi:DNA-binding NtrC family response regulator